MAVATQSSSIAKTQVQFGQTLGQGGGLPSDRAWTRRLVLKIVLQALFNEIVFSGLGREQSTRACPRLPWPKSHHFLVL
jgi:hypothetical protein